MPTKLTVNVTTGLAEEVEMTGDELAAFEFQRANPPIVYAGEQTLTNRVTTSGTTPRELFRRTLAPLTVYTALVDLIGIDSGNGATRYIRASVVVKRLNNGALIVGTPVVIANHADTAATTWAVTPSVDGTAFVISCTGAAGRSIDWFVRLQVNSFTPGGM